MMAVGMMAEEHQNLEAGDGGRGSAAPLSRCIYAHGVPWYTWRHRRTMYIAKSLHTCHMVCMCARCAHRPNVHRRARVALWYSNRCTLNWARG